MMEEIIDEKKKNQELKKILQDMSRIMQECIEDLTQYIDAEYPLRSQYSDEMRKHKRDMDIVFRATLIIIKAKEKINEQ